MRYKCIFKEVAASEENLYISVGGAIINGEDENFRR